ncbi:SprT family zinc-dependent metalloprotease [Methylomarinum sp. Ch1-1]|uniref:SprT family zinc-dependent metalloprotease n=1 Tax=Methylomarinum roseum TaxID=3067653 RepID=A0AAU7NWI4_9GAMM|nr:SprT family zinc-dependent metalloprotease [Methylomarinum sp. Ch1-1]MDP4522574.1 SprT family zinc-dependent metalloprotease [Methylomarinum sp. Ch1-1]
MGSIIEIGSITVALHRKAIKNLHISVLPPDGRVRISAPESMTDTAIRMAVIGRIPWIKRQQNEFAKQPRQSDREMVSGECHYLWGKRHRLNVLERAGRHEVKVGGGKIHLYVNAETSLENKTWVLSEYYRSVLKARIENLLEYWQEEIGVVASRWGVKKMKTKWGSCNTEAKRIWLNLELAKKPPECLEYILVHELIHLLERKHNERFKAYMDKFLPDWRERRDLLNSMPLGHNHWIY